MLADVLRADGHSVRVEYDGQAAASAIALERFQAAVLDIEMPFANGYELASALRTRCPDATLLTMTGRTSPDHVAQSKAAGFAEHFSKPVKFTLIRDRIRAAMADQPGAAS